MSQPDETAEIPRELADMPQDELARLAEEIGLDSTAAPSPRHLALAVHQRREAIAEMNREAMLEAARWARRPIAADADAERIAREIVQCKSMRFDGLSLEGLKVVATLRNIENFEGKTREELVKKLKKQEGFFTKLARKRRKWIGSMISSMLGENGAHKEHQYIPPAGATVEPGNTVVPPKGTLVQDIEEAGILGGLAGRIKREADEYLNLKLDEISNRIDQKLDDIDKRLSEWRDKEVANRLRIIKITLWASVIVAGISLVYGFVKVYILPAFH